jgi:hypothetical protein
MDPSAKSMPNSRTTFGSDTPRSWPMAAVSTDPLGSTPQQRESPRIQSYAEEAWDRYHRFIARPPQ